MLHNTLDLANKKENNAPPNRVYPGHSSSVTVPVLYNELMCAMYLCNTYSFKATYAHFFQTNRDILEDIAQ